MVETTAYTVEEFVASDGYRWKYRRYQPPSPPRAEIVYIHGIQSHAGWYGYSCSRLAETGYGVSFLDRRGSGMNDKDRGDARSFRRLLDDIAEFIGSIKDNTKPLFLIAVSWGGKLAVALQKRYPGLTDGIVLICPGFFPQVKLSLYQRMGILFSRLITPKREFPVPLDDPELFTATPKWLKFLREDRLAVHRATARFLVESVRLDGYLRFSRRSVKSPLLVLLGEKDRIIDNRKTRRFVESLATGQKTIIEYPRAHHTLEFEPEPDRYLCDVLKWLDAQVAGRA